MASHWWHAPIYIAMAITLLAIVLSTTTTTPSHPPPPSDQSTTTTTTTIKLISATHSLRSNGFNFIATLLHLSPHLFLSTPNSTIFAIRDSTFANLSLPPPFLKQLLLYHTLPTKYSMKDLLTNPLNTCLPTRFPSKNLLITKLDKSGIEINDVLISHPDLFLDGPFSIHGVDKPFASLNNYGDQESCLDIIQLPVCNPYTSSHSFVSSDYVETKKRNEWRRVVQLLSAKGFVPFAIGLYSLIDEIVEEHRELSSVTIFAPPNMPLPALPSPFLDKFVKLHIVPQSISFQELSLLPHESQLKTLASNNDLVVTTSMNLPQVLIINGVEVTAPDIFSSKKFTIHGIARAFGTGELSGLFLD